MITLRPANERGRSDFGWLDSRHTFSFGEYYDPRHVGFRALRVINEDWVRPGFGFPTHPHRDMEIITYVLEGAVEHRDSVGNRTVIRPGEVQRMSAGTGIQHSEYNPSSTDRLHLLQIWILPDSRDLRPSYEQRAFPADERRGRLRLVAARDGREGALTIHQDAEVYSGLLEVGDRVEHKLKTGRHAWVQVTRGTVTVDGITLGQGDGAATSEQSALEVCATSPGEILVFDLA